MSGNGGRERVGQGPREPAPAPIGQSVERLDGREKVTGQARYAADLTFPGLLHAKVIRSPHAHARIKTVDPQPALGPGRAVRVFTARDIAGTNLFGARGVKDQPVLASDRVRFVGEAVAVVVAETPAAAEAAAALVQVDYEVLPSCYSTEAALEPGAPLVNGKGNIAYERTLSRGDFAAALRQAALVVSNTYRTPASDHAFLETHAAVARPEADGGATVWATTKATHALLSDLAEVLGLPPDRLRVIPATVGGSFGGKPELPVPALAVLAALGTGRPVKLVETREETFQSSTKRHSAVIEATHAVAADGRLLGVRVDLVADAGAYTGSTPAIINRQIIHAVGPYYVPNVELRARAVFTNNPVSGAVRGFGVPQTNFAHELQMDALAERLGLDPLELRLRNVFRAGQKTVTGQTVPAGAGAEACLLRLRELLRKEDEAAAAAGGGAAGEAGRAGPGRLHGWGVSCFHYGNGRTGPADTGRCRLRREPGGHYTLYVGVPDVGQGSTTVLAQVVRGELGIPSEDLTLVAGDTGQTLETGATSATRVTVIVGGAVLGACRLMKEELARRLAAGVPVDAEPVEVSFEYRTASTALDADGQGEPYETYTYGAQAAKVSVDPTTGRVEVEKLIAVYDAGRVLNPLLFSGQVEGGALFGVGWALYEDLRLAEGRVLSRNFHTYLLPTAVDAPEVETVTVEGGDGTGPFGSKGIGEPAAVPTAAAVVNAIARATDVRFSSLPVTPERLYRALRGQ